MMASDDTKPPKDISTPSATAAPPRTVQGKDPFHDPWADWQPQWGKKPKRSKGKTSQTKAASETSVHDQQETHSPSQSVSLRVTAERHEIRCQRRIVDARLWDAMTPPQQDAALEIAKAYETMGRGLGYISSDWQRIPGTRGGGNIANAHSRLINRYIDWTKACHKEKISHSMIIDVLAFGFSCRALDRDRRVRAGSSRQNLLDGLSLYCQLQGWRPD